MLFEEVYRRFLEGDDDAPIAGVDDKTVEKGNFQSYLDAFFFKTNDKGTTSYERMCKHLDKIKNSDSKFTYIIVKRGKLKSTFNVVVTTEKAESLKDGCEVANFYPRDVWDDGDNFHTVEITTKAGKSRTQKTLFSAVTTQGKTQDLIGFIGVGGKVKEITLKRISEKFSPTETTALQEKLTGMMCLGYCKVKGDLPKENEFKGILETIGETYSPENDKKYRNFFSSWYKPCVRLSEVISSTFNKLKNYVFIYDNFSSDGKSYPHLQEFLFKGVWSGEGQRDLVNPSDIYFVKKTCLASENTGDFYRNERAVDSLNLLCGLLQEENRNMDAVEGACRQLDVPEKDIDYISNTKLDGKLSPEEYTNIHNALLRPGIIIPISLKKPGKTIAMNFISNSLTMENPHAVSKKHFRYEWNDAKNRPGKSSTIKNAVLDGRHINLLIAPKYLLSSSKRNDNKIQLTYRNTNGSSSNIQMGSLTADFCGHTSAQGGRGTEIANEFFVRNFKKLTKIYDDEIKTPSNVLKYISEEPNKSIAEKILPGFWSMEKQLGWETFFMKCLFGEKSQRNFVSKEQLFYFTKVAASALKYPIRYEGSDEELKGIFSDHNSKIVAYWKCY